MGGAGGVGMGLEPGGGSRGASAGGLGICAMNSPLSCSSINAVDVWEFRVIAA